MIVLTCFSYAVLCANVLLLSRAGFNRSQPDLRALHREGNGGLA
jgi:hypothetical protein